MLGNPMFDPWFLPLKKKGSHPPRSRSSEHLDGSDGLHRHVLVDLIILRQHMGVPSQI